MSLDSVLGLVQTALELGLISSLTVLALFLSYSMLGVCDLSTDGCFTLGATVGAAVAIAGHPYLSIPAAMLCGMLSGFGDGCFADENGRQQPAFRHHREYRALFRKHCRHGRLVGAQYEQNAECVF